MMALGTVRTRISTRGHLAHLRAGHLERVDEDVRKLIEEEGAYACHADVEEEQFSCELAPFTSIRRRPSRATAVRPN